MIKAEYFCLFQMYSYFILQVVSELQIFLVLNESLFSVFYNTDNSLLNAC